jgi:hypothetical protein
VNLIEERWYFLCLIDHDEALARQRLGLFAQKRGTLAEPDERVGIKQIDPMRIRVNGPEQRSLSGLPRSPQEQGMSWMLGQNKQTLNHCFLLS